jgi:hypothetical protein
MRAFFLLFTRPLIENVEKKVRRRPSPSLSRKRERG